MILSIDGILRPLLRRLRFSHETIALKKNRQVYRRKKNIQALFKNSGNSIPKNSIQENLNRSWKLSWLEERKIEDLPQYLFWPDEKRYSQVLWWGYGNDGLYFIEKGLGYKNASDNSNFLPAEESQYLKYLNSRCYS